MEAIYLGCIDLKDPLVLPSLLDLPLNVTNGVTLHKLDVKITQEDHTGRSHTGGGEGISEYDKNISESRSPGTGCQLNWTNQ